MKITEATKNHVTRDELQLKPLIERGPKKAIPCLSCGKPTTSCVVGCSIETGEWFRIDDITEDTDMPVLVGTMCYTCVSSENWPNDIPEEIVDKYTFSIIEDASA